MAGTWVGIQNKFMKLVAVVIPCYRDAATLRDALASVYAQTYSVDEVVVVNDCSPETEAIEIVLRDFPGVVYIKNKNNIGLAASRNVGVHASTCDVVSFLDADDVLHPQKIEIQLRVFDAGAAVSCKVRRFGGGLKDEHVVRYNDKYKTKEYADSREIILRNHLTGAALLISRELLLSVGGYDERLRSCEDFDLWLRLLDAGVKVKLISLPLYFYRINESGLSKNYTNISYWELQVLRKYFKRHARGGLDSPQDSRIWAFWLIKHLLRFELSLSDELRRETRKNIALLEKFPFLAISLMAIDKSRLFCFFVWLGNKLRG